MPPNLQFRQYVVGLSALAILCFAQRIQPDGEAHQLRTTLFEDLKDRDFRLTMADAQEIYSLKLDRGCRIVMFKRGGPAVKRFVGSGKKVKDILENTRHDSALILFKENLILRRPQWYDDEKRAERERFNEFEVSPGDIILDLGVD